MDDFFIKGTINKKLFIASGLISALIILAGIFPIVNQLFSSNQITETWIPKAENNFLIKYFYEFFGNNILILPILILSVLLFLIEISQKKYPSDFFPEGKWILFVWLIVCISLPYLRSILSTPILVSRYMIIILPAIVLLISRGMAGIKIRILSFLLCVIFVFLSFSKLFSEHGYFYSTNKTQFRELSNYLKQESNLSYPIFNNRISWAFSYYLRNDGLEKKLCEIDRNAFLKALCQGKIAEEFTHGFWFIGAHNEAKATYESLHSLNETHTLFKSKDFYDAWALLYLPKSN